jgi:uncharacterized membrane-anchored protein
MAAFAGLNFKIEQYGKMDDSFFVLTTNMIDPNLFLKGHWMVLYKVIICYVGRIFKMVTTAELIWI